MEYCEYSQTCPTVFGNGAVSVAGDKAKEWNLKKVMIVTDAGLVKAGVVAKVQDALDKVGVESVVFDKIMADPTDTVVNEGGALGIEEKIDGIIGLGGGSPMDAAKAINILQTNPAPISKYYLTWEYKKPLPLILIPTTAGTGSENTIYSVITDSETHAKKVALATATYAICDPELTYGLPPAMTAATGMDVFAHAAESMTGVITNPMTEILAFDAIRKVVKYLPIAVEDPTNAEARYNMLLASNFAGIAFSNTCCHLGHALSQCMGAAFHVPHGISCAWALPETMAYCAKDRYDKVQGVADALGVVYEPGEPHELLGKKVADSMRNLMRKIGVKPMADYDISKEQLVGIADMILADNCFPYIPTPMTKPDVEKFLAQVYDAYK